MFGLFGSEFHIFWGSLRSTPHPVTVTTRIITFLVGNSYKSSFVTVTGWGVDPRDLHIKKKMLLPKSAQFLSAIRCQVSQTNQCSDPENENVELWTGDFCLLELKLSPPRPNFQTFWEPLGKTILKETRKV